MTRPPVLLLFMLAALPLGAQEAPSAAGRGIGGLGLRPCTDFIGVENTPLLAQSADWLLGYMAGRIDSGDRRDPASQLSTTDQFDLITAIAGYCTGNPDEPLVAAARDYARSVFGTDPAHVVEGAAPDEVPRPELREDRPADPAARLDE